MTRQMEVEYLKPVPLGARLMLTGRHIEASGRVHRCEAELTNDDGVVLARAKGLFIEVDPNRLREVSAARG